MNNSLIQPFSDSFLNVLPQLGLSNVQMVGVTECGRKIDTPGVAVLVGIAGDLKGTMLFAMSEENAKMVATVMMGMETVEFDEMAQSAVCELSNMLAAGACTGLSEQGMSVDISTPTLMHGNFTASSSLCPVHQIKLTAQEQFFFIYVSLEEMKVKN